MSIERGQIHLYGNANGTTDVARFIPGIPAPLRHMTLPVEVGAIANWVEASQDTGIPSLTRCEMDFLRTGRLPEEAAA